MLIVDIVQSFLDLQCAVPPTDGPDSALRASSYSAITAALATQGYWVQSDILEKLLFSDLQLWAPLIYVFAVIGGLVGVAIGSPPRNYMWFFMGPAIYSWLIGTQIEVKGVRWTMPCVGDPQILRVFQRKVWELAEVGLVNTNQARILGPTAAGITKSSEPRAWVSVSSAFLWFDELMSSTTGALMRWSGLYNLETASGSADTNIPDLPTPSINGVPLGVMWSLYADVKWQALEEITSASIDSPDFRDAFSTFFVACGDPLRATFRVEAMMAAAASKGRRIPRTVITCGNNDNCGQLDRTYYEASTRLEEYIVEMPVSLKNVVATSLSDAGSWPSVPGDVPPDFMGPPAPVSSLDRVKTGDSINCKYYLFLLMQALRVEAAFRYHGLWNGIVPELIPDAGVTPDDTAREQMLISSLFYGWDIRRDRTWSDAFAVDSDGTLLNLEERQRFAYNLILAHLFRNEYMLTKEIAPIRQTNAEKTQYNVELALRTTSAKGKFSELYTWSLMLPYLQGALLYFLAMAYPFACVLVVVPGWHKAVFTWMSFWAWAKMWDIGFAVVKALERSIWAMTSQGGNVKYLSDRVVSLDTYVGRSDWVACRANSDPLCPIPMFELTGPGGVVNFAEPLSSNDGAMKAAWYLFDQGLVMSKALNLDLANSYYIFIMAGLYMSIPAVTGQLVLGARAGASSMVNSMIGGTASDASRAASSGVQGDMSMKLRSNAATIAQASEAKAMAAQGFAAQALGYSTKGLEEGRAASEAQAMSGAIGRVMGQNQNAMQMREAAGRYAQALANGVTGIAKSRMGQPGDTLPPDQQGGGGGGGGAGGWGGTGIATTEAAVSLGMAESNYQGASDFYGASNAYAAQQAGLGIREFAGNSNAAQLRTAEGNMGRYADFSAKQAAWHDRNAFANQVGGWSSALGIQTGNVDPGAKPTDMVGMAMGGKLRTHDGQNVAGGHAWHVDWSTKTGHRAGTASAADNLNTNYGSAAVRGAYHQWTPTEAGAAVLGPQAFSAKEQPAVTNPGSQTSRGPDADPASGPLAPLGRK